MAAGCGANRVALTSNLISWPGERLGLRLAVVGVGFFVCAFTAACRIPSLDSTSHSASHRLVTAFVDALNDRNGEVLDWLFVDEGATVHAERFAWNRFEVHQWLAHQAAGNLRISAKDVVPYGPRVAWTATIAREDWAAVGVPEVVADAVLTVRDGRIVDFTLRPSPQDIRRLEHRWRPDRTPEALHLH